MTKTFAISDDVYELFRKVRFQARASRTWSAEAWTVE